MATEDPYRRVLDQLGAAMEESGHKRAEFGELVGWAGDAMPRLVLAGRTGLSLRLAVKWAEICGRRIEVIKPGDPVSRVVEAIRADTAIPSAARKALEASYLAARRQLAEDPHARQRPRASGDR